MNDLRFNKCVPNVVRASNNDPNPAIFQNNILFCKQIAHVIF